MQWVKRSPSFNSVVLCGETPKWIYLWSLAQTRSFINIELINVCTCVHACWDCVYITTLRLSFSSIYPLWTSISLLTYYPLRQPHFLTDIFPRGCPPLNNQSSYHSFDSHHTGSFLQGRIISSFPGSLWKQRVADRVLGPAKRKWPLDMQNFSGLVTGHWLQFFPQPALMTLGKS